MTAASVAEGSNGTQAARTLRDNGMRAVLDKYIYEVTITGYAANGDGVARLGDGRVVFVRGAARGDVCEVSIVSERSGSCRAEIIRIIEPSAHRIEPDCPVYNICGGCDFRHISYEEELRAKLRRLNEALRRIGGVSVQADEILTTGQPESYRNKVVFHTTIKDGRTVIGFYRAASHDICPIERCPLLRDELNETLRGMWADPPPAGNEIKLRVGVNGLADPVEEILDGLVFRMSKNSFFQVNSGAALLLYKRARAYADLSASETLLDLYCGVGSLTLFLGRDSGKAFGIESNPDAVADARKNAELNGLNNVDFVCADAADWKTIDTLPDCVVVDPPRRGLSQKVINKIMEASPSRLVYVSCDPATLARDVKLLNKYEPRQVCAVDMFPGTANVETVVLLSKLKSTTSIKVKIDLDKMLDIFSK